MVFVSSLASAEPGASTSDGTGHCYQSGESLVQAIERLEKRKWGLGEPPLTDVERSCSFALQFKKFNQEQRLEQIERVTDPKIWRAVDEYMLMNREAIDRIIDLARAQDRVTRDRETWDEIRSALYFVEANGGLQPQGGDFLTTALFLLNGHVDEANPLMAPILNDERIHVRARIGVVAAAAWLGAWGTRTVTERLPGTLAEIARNLALLLETVAIGTNNEMNWAAGLPLVSMKVLTARVNATTTVSFYIAPRMKGALWSGPDGWGVLTPGIGLSVSVRF